VEDYGHTGLTLREHPIAFLRRDPTSRSIVTCEEAMNARDGRWLMTAGLVLVRQKPGSVSGDLSGLADRDLSFKLPTGRGDEFAHGSPGGGDSRYRAPRPKPRDIFIPDLHIDTRKVKSRNFP